jgi:hypothetical protein
MDAFVVGGFALLGVALGWLLQRRSLGEESAARRRAEAAAALAPIKALLVDAHPQRLTLWNAELQQKEVLPRIVADWRRGRESLLELSIGHPRPRCES